MGALKSGAFPVELNGKEYGLLFSLNALDEVQEKFGGYDKLSEVFNKDNSDTENENDGEETTEEGNRAAVQEN